MTLVVALLLALVLGLVSDGCMKRKESILYHFTLGDSGLKSASETCAEPCNHINVQHDLTVYFEKQTLNFINFV